MKPQQRLACVFMGSPEAVFSLEEEDDGVVIRVEHDGYQAGAGPSWIFSPSKARRCKASAARLSPRYTQR